jgi:2-polyprenyl-6-methoxyphenol hydroxylase-like FAD-dependent oxidoreductase
VLERFGRWHHPIPDLVTATPADTVLHHDIFELAVPLPSYVRGRAALLGDAAHAMISDLGQGACQALEDAVVLCAALAAEPDIAAALRVYDQQRRPRAQRIATASRQMGRLTLMEGKARVLLRNMAVRAAPAAAGRRRLTEIGGWSPPDLPVGVPPTSGSIR